MDENSISVVNNFIFIFYIRQMFISTYFATIDTRVSDARVTAALGFVWHTSFSVKQVGEL